MTNLTRRHFIHYSAALLATPALAQEADDGSTEIEQEISQGVRHNVSSFRTLEWQPYFSNLKNGAVLVDISSRALHFWSEDENTYKLYPTSVPMTDDLTRRGRTSITRKGAWTQLATHPCDEKTQSGMARLYWPRPG